MEYDEEVDITADDDEYAVGDDSYDATIKG
jgi:hypothetical protein